MSNDEKKFRLYVAGCILGYLIGCVLVTMIFTAGV